MANWSGTRTITAGANGVSTGGNTSNTFNNTAATWPTVAPNDLVNYTLRILSGTGAGQERIVASNTVNQITIVGTWTTIPDNTSAYELVLKFNVSGSDHITANLVLSTNVITELQDSSTLLFDGLFSITLSTSVVVRWAKTESTIVTFDANNASIQGKAGFWSQIIISASLTAAAPQIKFLKLKNGTSGFSIGVVQTLANFFDNISHIWIEHITTNITSITVGVQTQDVVLKNFFQRRSRGGTLSFNTTASAGVKQRYFRFWSENAFSGAPNVGATGPDRKEIIASIFKESIDTPGNVSLAASKTYLMQDSYLRSYGADAVGVLDPTSTPGAGNVDIMNNTFMASRAVLVGATDVVGTAFSSKFNDYIAKDLPHANQALEVAAGGTFSGGTLTSDHDYIAGKQLASPDNVDTTNSTTSTANPQQYSGLTSARTRAQSVRNRPLDIDNVVVSGITDTEVTITFDCKNGAPLSATVDADSASGQPTLNVSNTDDFSIGEQLEINYGGPRSETHRILSINPGVSVTFEDNLSFTHLAADADEVKKRMRQVALPHVEYGLVSNIYSNSTPIPEPDDWGLIYAQIINSLHGQPIAWNRTGHSVTLKGLTPDTTYYFRAHAFNPFEEQLSSAEMSFTTAVSSKFTDPGQTNVRLGTAYKFNSATNNRTGTVRVPTAAQVKVGTLFEDADSVTGTYDGSDRWTDPGQTNVKLGIAYKANSLVNNRLGTVRIPAVGDVRDGVLYGDADSLEGTLGDGTPPTFAGIATLVPQNDGSLLASWSAATDPSTPIRYHVYIQANTATGIFTVAHYATTELSLRIYALALGGVLTKDVTYFVGVRAEDNSGNMETNTVTLSAVSSGVADGDNVYQVAGQFSLNAAGEIAGTLWMTQDGMRILSGLGAANYTVLDDTGAAVSGLSETGLTADGNGLFHITPIDAADIQTLRHYVVKIGIIVNGNEIIGFHGIQRLD